MTKIGCSMPGYDMCVEKGRFGMGNGSQLERWLSGVA